MGVLFDYFIAADDRVAAEVINRDGGPGSSRPQRRLAARGLFGRRPKAEPNSDGAPLPTVADAGFDPVVQATTLEELLTGRPYDDISDEVGWGRTVASRDGERAVVAVSNTLVDALASADDATLGAAMVPWSQTEEFWGAGEPETLLLIVRDLAQLARDAKQANQRIYCWTCV